MSLPVPERRLLLVHAHPDDETLGQGATMAKYAAEGTHVTLVTCTRGEEGEVLLPEIAHYAADQDDRLGEHRVTELANAMKALGVTDHRFLGGAGHYRDSGMEWHPDGHAVPLSESRDDTFWAADLREAATLLVEVLREVRPQVLVTYDDFGGYGHPDHIQAHRVAMYAVALAAVPSYRRDLGEAWDVPKVYWGAFPEGALRRMLARVRAAGDTKTFEGMEPDGPLPPFVIPDSDVDAVVDAGDFVEAKLGAIRAHASQIAEDDGIFRAWATIEDVGERREFGVESYRLARGTRGPVGEAGHETDLFAGL